MIFTVLAIGIFFIILERIIPDQKLPHVQGWWGRVLIVNLFQLAILVLGGYTWDRWFQNYSLFRLSDYLPPVISVLTAYFLLTFIYYWWHRWRHDVGFLWNALHQLHHSPQRIETITSFYKHPLEIVVNSLLIGAVVYVVLGLSVDSGAWILFLTSTAEYFYHMNIKTPRWAGYFLQRPEMHRIHHQRGRHYGNFADLPLWDMLFGTYKNPPLVDSACGFLPEREAKFADMLLFQNVNNPSRKK